MRIRWLSGLLIILVASATIEARDRLVVDAAFDPQTRSISGSILYEPGARKLVLTELRFQLYPNLFCREDSSCGIKIDSVRAGDDDPTSKITIESTNLIVPLSNPVPPGEAIDATIWFTTYLSKANSRLGYGESQFTLAEWFPVPAPWRESGWQEVAYRKFLEPTADLADIEARIVYPDSLQLIAPGVVTTETVEGRSVTRIGMEAASGAPLQFATGYQLDSTDVSGTALKLYYREHDSFMVDTVRAAATAALVYMSDSVLVYPFDELIIVIGGLSEGGGLEQPRMILASTPSRTVRTGFYASMIVHEVVHQWFYGIVNSSQAGTPWLDESVTEYFSLKIGRRRAQGEPNLLNAFGMTANHLMQHRAAASSYMSTDPITRRGEDYFDQATYYRTIYSKGTLIVQTLTALMGDEGEASFWREYADSFKYAVPETEDFARLATKYLPEEDGGDARTILDHNRDTDFAIISLRTENVQTDADSLQSEEGDSLVWKASIDYLAQHPLGFPVGFRVVLLDGTVIDTVLNPTSGRHRIKYETASPAVAAIIDPDFQYALDDDFLNNSLTRGQSRGAALRLFSGVTFLVESLFSSLWGW